MSPWNISASRPGMRATTAHTRALGMFDAQGGLGARGVPLGDILSGGGLFVYSAFEVYPEIVTDPNMAIFGIVGQRKSTACKCLLAREFVLGRFMRVVDIKGEYLLLATHLGGTVIKLARGGTVRLNPLASDDRQELLQAVARAVLPRPLSEFEPALLNIALKDTCDAMAEPTLPEVVHRLFNPTETMAREAHTTTARFAEEARPVAMALQPLIAGDLAGMFDGPTTPGLDFDAQFVVLDLSAMINSASLGILMSCAMAFLQSAINRQRDRMEQAGFESPKTILLLDEAWRVFSLSGMDEWLCSQFKLSRQIGQSNVIVQHRPSDLHAAGDDGSRTAKLIEGLLDDCQTFVLFRLEGDELTAAAQMLNLSSTETERIRQLRPGQALWRVGANYRAVVQTAVTSIDLPLTYTDQRMAVR